MKSCWITDQGKRIFYGDFRDLHSEDLDLLQAELAEVERVICLEPAGSLLLLFDFRGSVATTEAMGLWKPFVVHIAHHVDRLAAVGITGFKRVLFDVLRLLSGLNAMPFEEMEPALAWLVG
jgi:hypothetical protein